MQSAPFVRVSVGLWMAGLTIAAATAVPADHIESNMTAQCGIYQTAQSNKQHVLSRVKRCSYQVLASYYVVGNQPSRASDYHGPRWSK